MADEANSEILQLSSIYIVFNLNCKPMPTLLDNAFRKGFIGLRDEQVAVGISKLEVHTNAFHVKARSLEPMH